MNKAEREYCNAVVQLGCIACAKLGFLDSPAGIHHKRTGTGRMRASHYDVLPLCGAHHQTGGYGVAFHAGQRAWERVFGSELDLIAEVKAKVGFHAIK